MRAISVLSILSLLLPVAAGAGDAQDRRLHVIIISVEAYENGPWRNPSLSAETHAATDDLAKFFKTKFPAAVLHVRRLPSETTGQALTDFIRHDFKSIADGNVTLLFLIGHGEAYRSANPLYSSDMRLVGSDATQDTLEQKSIRVGFDVIHAFDDLAKGSIVLMFVDACYSGAAASPQLQVQSALQATLGAKSMVIASALPDTTSSGAAFTKALLRVWNSQQNTCTGNYQIPALLREALPVSRNGEPGEGVVDVVVPYFGNLCLEMFEAHNALVILHNQSANRLLAQVKDPTLRRPTPIPLDADAMTPIRLNRSHVSVDVFWRSERQFSKEYDLSTSEIVFDTVGTPPTLVAYGMGAERAATVAEQLGATPAAVAGLLKRAYAAYVSIKDTPAAERVATRLAYESLADDLWSFLRRTSRLSGDDLVAAQAKFDVNEQQLARELELTGHFSEAAELYKEAALQSRQIGESSAAASLGEKAYLAYGAANQPAQAKEVRESLRVNAKAACDKCAVAERDAIESKRIEAAGDFKSKAATAALSKDIQKEKQ